MHAHSNGFFPLDSVSFLGISIVGQTSEDGAGGIYVGTVMKGYDSVRPCSPCMCDCTLLFHSGELLQQMAG